ncbi:MAG TPA: hypothetical protein VH352_09540 [Pseudonocardiaceae bacterium]|jgi:hypothetical protein|nr:hypothetical protein [Pseudonocardiaceae bacterium]
MSGLKEKWQDAFDWLTEQWTDDDTPWSDHRAGFLEKMGLSEASGDAEVAALFERIDEELTDDNRRAKLTDGTKRAEFFPELHKAAKDADKVKIEPYWNGEEWFTWNAGKEEWEPMAPPEEAVAADKDVKPYWDGEQWLTWDAEAQQWLPMSDAETAEA